MFISISLVIMAGILKTQFKCWLKSVVKVKLKHQEEKLPKLINRKRALRE